MKKKILIIQSVIPHYNVEFFNKFDDDFDLTVAADASTKGTLNNGLLLNYNFKIINIEVKNLFFGFTWSKGLFRHIVNNKFDAIILNSNPRDLSQLILSILKFRKVYSWGMFHRIGKTKFISQIAFFIYSFCSKRVLVYARRGALNLKSLFIDDTKITIIGNGLSIKPKLTELPSTVNGLKILQVVRLSEYKKPDFCILAIKKILEKNPKAKIQFNIIGDGPEHDKIAKKINQLDLLEHVFMHGSIYDENVLEKFFSNSHISIVPTCIGLSAHHSFSYGCPVITDDSLSEQASEFDILQDKYNSIIYKANSIDSLVSCIENIAEDPRLLSDLRYGAYKTASLNNTQSKYENFKIGLKLDD